MGICMRIEATERSGATAPTPSPMRALDAELEDILSMAQHEDFEAGIHSQFEAHLRGLVGRYGESAITALHNRMQQGLKTDIIIEALGALSRMRQGLTRDARLATLAAFLRHREASIRDAAMRGLLDLEDRRARAPLLEALGAEANKLLKKSLAQVLALLPE